MFSKASVAKSDTTLRKSKQERPMKHKLKGEGLFSDDEEDNVLKRKSKSKKFSTRTLSECKIDSGTYPAPTLDNDSEVNDDLDFFSKTLQISNVEQIDHISLIKKMHDRFEKKAIKWERGATLYSRWSFGLNFFILSMQMVQLLFEPIIDLFQLKTKRPQAFRCVLMAFTGLVAGLQMKLKLTQKAEKYRRGAKVYGKLRRISTYYLMLVETGGTINDVTGLWREALVKEGRGIPAVKTFIAL